MDTPKLLNSRALPLLCVFLLPMLISLRSFKSTETSFTVQPVAESDVTLVTAWYPDPFPDPESDGSTFFTERHNSTIYFEGIKSFFAQITTPIVIFCPSQVVPELTALRPSSLPAIFITEFESIWDFKAIDPLYNFLDTDKKIIDESSYDLLPRTPHQFAVWNAKPTMLNEVANRNPYHSSYFFWHDIGAMRVRGEKFRHWPDVSRVRKVMERKGHVDTILLNVMGKLPCYIDAGSLVRHPPEISFTLYANFFGGSKAAVNWFNASFYDLLSFYLSRGIFTGREERLFHALAYLEPDKFTAVPAFQHESSLPDDELQMHVWFYRNFLARRDEMWNIQRLIPSAPLFHSVPFDRSCAAEKSWYEALSDWIELTRVHLINGWSEIKYHSQRHFFT